MLEVGSGTVATTPRPLGPPSHVVQRSVVPQSASPTGLSRSHASQAWRPISTAPRYSPSGLLARSRIKLGQPGPPSHFSVSKSSNHASTIANCSDPNGSNRTLDIEVTVSQATPVVSNAIPAEGARNRCQVRHSGRQ